MERAAMVAAEEGILTRTIRPLHQNVEGLYRYVARHH